MPRVKQSNPRRVCVINEVNRTTFVGYRKRPNLYTKGEKRNFAANLIKNIK